MLFVLLQNRKQHKSHKLEYARQASWISTAFVALEGSACHIPSFDCK